MKQKHYVSWKDVEQFVNEVTSQFNGKVNGVYGLPRGGLVLAVILSHKLNVPLLEGAFPGCLVVDDICDPGESLIHYRKNSSGNKKGYTIATMYYKKNELGIVPDYYMFEKNDSWIVFPWEGED